MAHWQSTNAMDKFMMDGCYILLAWKTRYQSIMSSIHISPDVIDSYQSRQMTLSQLALVLGTLTVFVVWMTRQRPGAHLPPGPKKLPFIGNILSMPSTLEWETFVKWGQEHSARLIDPPHSFHLLMPLTDSDIIHVNALGTSIVILNSYKVAADLLVERSSIYSSR